VSNLRMKVRLLVASLSVLCSVSATAQLSGQFYLDKTVFAPGEPIFLYVKVVNLGKSPAMINATQMPEAPSCAGYEINISRNPPDASCPNFKMNMCNMNGQFSYATVPPGGTYTERIFLNFDSELKDPGEYSIDADSKLNIQAKLHLRVDADAPALDATAFQLWVDQLQSPEKRKRIEAARVLASLAPPSFEDVLLSFGDDPNLRFLAPLAFYHLNTPRGIAALAALVEGPSTNEQIEAVGYLAKTGDQKWLPLLLDAAQRYAGSSSFPTAAAELGGDRAVPMLVALEKSPDRKFAALNAVMAMGYTGSRAAIPALLEYLKSPDPDLAQRANASLQMLTHLTAKAGERITPPTNYPKWSRWWEGEGTTAPIYKATGDYCGPLLPLP
jgi:hypothetical protein